MFPLCAHDDIVPKSYVWDLMWQGCQMTASIPNDPLAGTSDNGPFEIAISSPPPTSGRLKVNTATSSTACRHTSIFLSDQHPRTKDHVESLVLILYGLDEHPLGVEHSSTTHRNVNCTSDARAIGFSSHRESE